MVKKTLLCFLFFIGSYSLILLLTKDADIKLYPKNQLQENIFKVQHYLYTDTTSYRGIILGSSLSDRILYSKIPYIFNLSLTGYGPLDGFHILKRKEKLPAIILVETNFIFRLENRAFDDYDNNCFFYSKKLLPALREENQVITRSLALAKYFMGKTEGKITPVHTMPDEKLFQRLLQDQMKAFGRVDTHQLTLSLHRLQQFVMEFEKRGSQICFFEMPVNHGLINSPQSLIVRKYFMEYFPKSKYKYLSLPSIRFHTTDGLHLGNSEAPIYTEYFKNWIENSVLKTSGRIILK